MKNELLNEDARISIASNIFWCYKQNKMIDENTIESIILTLVKSYDLYDYINNVKFKYMDNSNANMAYSYFDKTIYIAPNFIDNIQRSSEKLLELFRINDKLISTNLDILHAILHEVNHARQYKYITSHDSNDLKSILLKLSLSAYMVDTSYKEDIKNNISPGSSIKSKEVIKFAKISQDNIDIYKLLPSEIDAEIESIRQIKWICEKMSLKETYKYIDFYQMSLDLIIKDRYKKSLFGVKYPVKYFIKERNKYVKSEYINLNDKINKSKSLDLDVRINLGLPITSSELDEVDKRINDKLEELYNFKKMYGSM